MKRIILGKIVIGILLVSTFTSPIQSQLNLPEPSVSMELRVSPQYKITNVPLVFTATITASNTTLVNNVSLHINTGAKNFTTLMEKQSGLEYNKSITFNTSTSMTTAKAELYYNNTLEASDIVSFSIKDPATENIPVGVSFDNSTDLPPGNFSISTPNNEVSLDITTTSPVQFKISKIKADKVVKPVGSTFISNVYDIHFNSTKNLTSGKLTISYNQSIIDKLGVIEDHLKLQRRNTSEDKWTKINGTVNTTNNSISVNTSSFSEWSVTAENPKLRFENISFPDTVQERKEVKIGIEVKNYGSFEVKNMTVSLITPSSILLNNMTNSLSNHNLSALETLKVTWNLIFTEKGEYQIVLTSQADNADGDITSISVSVVNDNDPPSQSLSETSSANFVQFSIILQSLTMTVIMVIYLRKNKAK